MRRSPTQAMQLRRRDMQGGTACRTFLGGSPAAVTRPLHPHPPGATLAQRPPAPPLPALPPPQACWPASLCRRASPNNSYVCGEPDSVTAVGTASTGDQTMPDDQPVAAADFDGDGEVGVAAAPLPHASGCCLLRMGGILTACVLRRAGRPVALFQVQRSGCWCSLPAAVAAAARSSPAHQPLWPLCRRTFSMRTTTGMACLM
jgi:hypothetical protein